MEPDPQVSRLLKLKRYEQPPAGYEQAFLREFQRRQRAGLLRPWYERVWEQIMQIWPEFEVPKLAYAGAAAGAVIAAAFLVTSPAPSSGSLAAAKKSDLTHLSLNLPNPVMISGAMPVSGQVGDQSVSGSSQAPQSPHYVLQPRPSSTEMPLSF